MGKNEKVKSFRIKVVKVEHPDYTPEEIVRRIVSKELRKMLDSHGVVSYNLDEVLSKYITGDMSYDKRG